jgi:hypothetical protein
MAAEAWVVGLHLFAAHLGPTPPHIDRFIATPGAYVAHSSGFTVGGYKNSLRRESYYVGYMVGAITGYDKSSMAVVAFSYRFGDQVGARLTWVPDRTQPLGLSVEVHH